MYKRIGLLILLVITTSNLFAFDDAPKRELRAVWIASVGNIDWPSKPGLSVEQQQQEFITQLNFLQQCGFNAVIVQIRPSSDALYASPYEPWSFYLTGKQGLAPTPFYDPLSFMVAEVHKRNMEFHAWINPFRALVTSSRASKVPYNHVVSQHPEWICNYAGKSYINPGIPEARQYVLTIIADIVSRYDIDAIHIDDYFYPYKEGKRPFPDQYAYQQSGGNMTIDDWRRQNINRFMEGLYTTVKSRKSWVQIGVSPFGIWRNATQDPRGSNTHGGSCYDDLYADILLWINNKWIDYCAPQLYWEHGHKQAPYEVLVPWWRQNTPQTKLYIGLGLYRMAGSNSGKFTGPNEILQEIRTARYYGSNGICMYSLSSFKKISTALQDSLRQHYFGTIAIPPANRTFDSIPPVAPISQVAFFRNGAHITWRTGPTNETIKYLVYRFKPGEPVNLSNAVNIIALTQANDFWDYENPGNDQYKYVVTALDRSWNESMASHAKVGLP